jgi:hypothetical protein
MRDGRWLKAGIQQYETFQAAQKDHSIPLSVEDAGGAMMFVGYFRGVLDVHYSLAMRARYLTEGANKAREEKRASREWARGSNDGMWVLVPLARSEFPDRKYELDQYAQMLKNYLEKHPEKWDTDAETLIEYMLWETFPQKK